MNWLVLLLLVASVPVEANREGNGGNVIAADFAAIAYWAVLGIEVSQQSGESHFEGLDTSELRYALGTTEVYAVKNLCKKVEVDYERPYPICDQARYLKEKSQIQFDSDAWLEKTCLQKMQLALHEYGRAAGIENASYFYSARMPFSSAITTQCEFYDNQTR